MRKISQYHTARVMSQFGNTALPSGAKVCHLAERFSSATVALKEAKIQALTSGADRIEIDSVTAYGDSTATWELRGAGGKVVNLDKRVGVKLNWVNQD